MNWRTALAFVTAPAIVPLCLFLYVRASSTPQEMARVQITYAFMFVICYGLAVLVGMPMYHFMRKHGYHRIPHYVLGGAIIGAVPGVSLLLANLPSIAVEVLVPILVGSLVGVFSAVVFWLIGIAEFDTGSNKKIEPTR